MPWREYSGPQCALFIIVKHHQKRGKRLRVEEDPHADEVEEEDSKHSVFFCRRRQTVAAVLGNESSSSIFHPSLCASRTEREGVLHQRKRRHRRDVLLDVSPKKRQYSDELRLLKGHNTLIVVLKLN